GTEGYDSTLAHEFQHMIHWHQDRNEDSWVNEGLSMLAQQVSGLPVGNLHEFYLRQPDLQLTTWEDEGNTAHYGASYLLMAYLLDRYGKGAVRALVEAQPNGVQGFNEVLPRVGGEDFRAFFAEWLVANLLDRTLVADGRYAYRTLDPPTPTVERLRAPADEPYRGFVRPYGVDYLELDPEAVGRVRFSGQPFARLVPATPHSGRFAWWSHRGDNSDTRLTRAFDLSGLSQATLEFWLWYDLERDYDYAYVSVSTDGGRSWTLLRGPHATDANPTGNNLGWGYNGLSGVAHGEKGEPAWVSETVDLTPYVGQKVWVRFEVVTDDAVNHPGLLLDDIRIPELGFADDVEAGEDGWQAEGFVRVDNLVPQEWLLQVVVEGPQETRVEEVPVREGQATWEPQDLPPSVRRVVLAVSATPAFTTEPVSYWLWVEPPAAEATR
ncbi:MAG: immune inhibitor A, partial [Anaerolineae bacterium]|nr:immune inhibitor A [Anaerolineae bacterium]